MNPEQAKAFVRRLKLEWPAMSVDRLASMAGFLADAPAEYAEDVFRRVVLGCESDFGPTTKAVIEAFQTVAHENKLSKQQPTEGWSPERKSMAFRDAIPLLLEWRAKKRAHKEFVAEWVDEWLDRLVKRVERGELPAPPSMAHLVSGYTPF